MNFVISIIVNIHYYIKDIFLNSVDRPDIDTISDMVDSVIQTDDKQ
jgi:hypothetical protein